jgi:uncharacterized protein (TIGR03066 family)
MRTVLGCAAVLLLACGTTVAGQAKIDAKKLVGKWEPVAEKEPGDPKDKKDKKEKAPPGPAMLVEFAANNKMTMTVTDAGKEIKVEGTYKLEADKLSVQMKLRDKEVTETLTVKKLTDDELVTEDSKNKTETLKRKR